MPTTFIGLVLFVAFLTPGFLYTSHRRRLVPRSADTALMETTSIVSISLVANVGVIVALTAARGLLPDHTPEFPRAVDYGSGYWIENLGYMLAWSGGALALSCLLAVGFARCEPVRRAARSRAARWLSRWRPTRLVIGSFAPATIIETSSWNETFAVNDYHYVYLGVQLRDGSYLSGRLVWFSTEIEETADRDLVLGAPLSLRYEGADEPVALPGERTVVSAREVVRIDMTPVAV
jgi:hypothetical protein